MVVAVVLVVAVPYSSLDLPYSFLCACVELAISRAPSPSFENRIKGMEYNSMWYEGGKLVEGNESRSQSEGGGGG